MDDLINFLRDDELVADEFINEPEEINNQPSNTEITDQTITQINPLFVADIHAVMMVHDEVTYFEDAQDEDVQDVYHVVDLSRFEPDDLPAQNQLRDEQQPQNDLALDPFDFSVENSAAREQEAQNDSSYEFDGLAAENPAINGQEPKNNLLRTTNKRRNERRLDEWHKESFVQVY